MALLMHYNNLGKHRWCELTYMYLYGTANFGLLIILILPVAQHTLAFIAAVGAFNNMYGWMCTEIPIKLYIIDITLSKAFNLLHLLFC